MRIVLPTVSNDYFAAHSEQIFIFSSQKLGLDSAVALVECKKLIGKRVKGCVLHQQDVRVVFFVSLNEVPEIIGPCYHDGITQIDVVFVSVYVGDDPQKSGELGHDSEETHRLRPPMPESALSRQDCLVAQPLVKDIAEKHHARVHVEPPLPVKDFMSHHIRHCCPPRKTSEALHFVQCLKQIVAEGKVFTGDVCFTPYLEFEVRVELHILLDNYAFGLRHLPSDPYLMDNLWDEVRLTSFSVGLILIRWVKDRKLSHCLPILHQMVHVVSHWEGLNLIFVKLELISIHSIPSISVDR